MAKKETLGTVHPKKSMFLRINVGTAEAEDGTVYEMTVQAGDHSPIVHNSKTGRYWTISWAELINLAKDAGIDKK